MKKGISLIVLVITIIVIIILAGAVILSLANNNPIAQANQATRESDADAVQSALSMYLGRVMAEYKGPVKLGTAAYTPITTGTVAIQTTSGAQLYRNPTATGTTPIIATYTTDALATAAGYTEKLLVTNTALGLASWPTYAGFSLQVDQNGDVKWF